MMIFNDAIHEEAAQPYSLGNSVRIVLVSVAVIATPFLLNAVTL